MFGVGRQYLDRELGERVRVGEAGKLMERGYAGEGVNEEQ